MSAPKPPKHFWLAHLVRGTVGVIVSACFRTKVVGASNMPAGGTIVAGNHVSYADPVLLWCRSPRPVHFMAKSELWAHPVFGWFLDRFWAFPVRRGAADREALTTASTYLKAGEPVGVFPEGTRTSDGDSEAHGGAAFLALRNGVPITPVGISGTELIKPKGSKFLRFPKVVISIGEPIRPEDFTEGGRKEKVDAMTEMLMSRIREQVAHAREVGGR